MGSATLQITFPRREWAELSSVPADSRTLEAGEVAGRTLASLISAGTELAGSYQGESFPATPGYAAVFRVEQVGAGVEDVSVGDIVLAMGPHCSHQRHAARNVWPVPHGLAPTEAVFARLMGVSMSSLATTTAAQIFAACGYTVLGSDPDPARRELAQRGGIADVRALPPLDDPSWNGRTALVLECSGHEEAALAACNVVKKRGEVVLIGVPWRQRCALSAHQLLHTVFHRYAVVRSGWEWELPTHETELRTGDIHSNIAAALRWLREGRVRVADLFAVYAPQECQAAYQSLLHEKQKSLAVVFDWTTDTAP